AAWPRVRIRARRGARGVAVFRTRHAHRAAACANSRRTKPRGAGARRRTRAVRSARAVCHQLMPTPLHTPRVNNNDDTVRLVKLLVKPGDEVRVGQLVAEVETDKANFTVESDRDGYVLAVEKALNDTIDVGSVLLWLGASTDEIVRAGALAVHSP